MRLDSRILTIVVIPDAEPKQATVLQGFAPSLCENPWVLGSVLFFPSSIIDLTPEGQETLLRRRISGANPINWVVQTPRALKAQRVPMEAPFVVVLLPPGLDAGEYLEWAQQSVVPPTIVAETGGDLSFSDLSMERLQARFLRVCDLIPKSIGALVIETVREAIQSWAPAVQRPLGYQVGGHNSIAPNLTIGKSKLSLRNC